ncbi:MAG: helix-turn-helix domain-containing protein [Planctomycetes bacterium]|nr:helix-turn-helix domain-containing protein [Planctomycetota bacterium]
MSSTEAQEELGISRPTLYLWVRQGKLKPQRAGRGLRFQEDEVMRLLGRGPRVSAWVRRGRIEEAKRDVKRWARTGERPTVLLEYLTAPTPDRVRARVVAEGDGTEVRVPAPGGVLFDALLESMKRREYVFISHEESVWLIHDVRAETSPAGGAYIAMELERPGGPGEGGERDRSLKEFVGALRSGLYTGPVKPWKREELNGRGPG